MGKHDFEVELPQDPPDPEALHAPVERTRLQNFVTWLALLPVVGCAVAGLVYGWSLSTLAAAEITRITDLVANASTAIAPYAADLQQWSLPPADVETVWRSAQSERLVALKEHLNGTRLLMGLAGFAFLPAFIIWNRGQFGRPEGSPRLDVVQLGLCLLSVGLIAGAWHYDAGKHDAVIKVGSAQGLGVRAKALAAEGKARHLAPWRETLDEALASLRPPLEAGVDYAKLAESVTTSVHQPEFGLLTDAQKLELRETIESLAQAHFTGVAFEPLARAQEPFIGRNGVTELLLERERESRTFASDDEAAEYLFNAIQKDNEAEVRMMIRRGIDVDVLKPGPEGGYTPLHATVFYRRPALARLLVEHCARTDIPCGGTGPLAQGDFPLHTAVGDPGLMKLLLDHRADPNAANAAGRTPLHVAAMCGDRSSIKLLAARNANVNALDAACQTPLDLANDPTATDAARGAHPLLQQLGGRLAPDLQPPDAAVAATPQQ